MALPLPSRTPSKALNRSRTPGERSPCGGQAAIPVLHAVSKRCTPTYMQVVSTGASASAGRATPETPWPARWS
ncbi:hypothetical protein AB0H03_26955 [Streptomyces sparsogenes]|uniref:hypothetical protein n=1 Tax=Streptomyces sparsogenes TaxID=67365 RepID=UPI0033DD2E50